MNKKKVIVLVITLLVIVLVMGVGIFGFSWYQRNNLTAEVQPVEYLVWYYGGNEMTSYGMVTNDFYQDVYLLDSQTIEEIYVEEGQEVKVGDKLLSYDMTLSNIQIEMQELEVESLKNKIILANRELEELKKQTPISENLNQTDNEVTTNRIQIDSVTGAYYFISGETSIELASNSGTGTPIDPYIILCMPGCYVEGAWFNEIVAKEELVCVKLQIIDPVTNVAVPDMFWDITSRQLSDIGIYFEDTGRWSVETRQQLGPEEEIEPDVILQPEGYTAAELAEAIKTAEKNIKNLDLQKRQAQLQLEQMKKITEDGVVTATVDGIVKNLGDMNNPPVDGTPFLTVAGSEGLYVTGAISELMLDEIQVGQIVYANSWESGMSFEATIQEISPYPSDENNSWGEGNPNVSYYPYIAYIADTQGLKNGEYVDLTMTSQNHMEDDFSAIYLDKAYIREEDGKSYVLIADERDRLKKQYVETGKTIYGEAIEIVSGLSMEDRIAFPYGKTAKEGVKVKEASDFGMMYY